VITNLTLGDELLSRLLRGEAGGGELENRLLAELHAGYPATKLRLLLRADHEQIIASGVWLAAELGVGARPLLDDVVGLIHHPFLKVRFFALDYLVACTGPADGRAIGLGLDLIEDPEPSVRWCALVFLATLSDAQLRAGLLATAGDERAMAHKQGLQLLLGAAASPDTAAITSHLASTDSMLHKYAAAAAARIVRRDPRPLMQAIDSVDPTIKQFAMDMAERAGISLGP